MFPCLQTCSRLKSPSFRIAVHAFRRSKLLNFSIFSYLYLQYANIKYLSFIVRLAVVNCGTISGSTRDSGRQTLFHIEICMVIDALKPNKYVHTKKLGPYNAMALGIALELIEFCCLRAGARLQQF